MARIRSLPFGLALLISLVVLFSPGSDLPAGPWWSDDVVHVSLFTLLCATGLALPVRAVVLAGWLAGYAALSEVIQGLVPLQRSASLLDVLADLVGIGLGLAAGLALRRRRRARSAESA